MFGTGVGPLDVPLPNRDTYPIAVENVETMERMVIAESSTLDAKLP